MMRIGWRCTSVAVIVGTAWLIGTAPASAAGCPNETVRDQADRALPDCRAYEQVSPPDKNGNDVGLGGQGIPTYVAAAGGSAFAFETIGALPGALSSSGISQNLSQRGDTGWTTKAVAPPLGAVAPFDAPAFQYFSPDLMRSVVRVPASPGLAADDTVGAANMYLRDNAQDTYRTLSVRSPSGPLPTGTTGYAFAGASADLHHVLFEADAALTPNAPPARSLYEWVDGQLRLVSILPDGTPAPFGSGAGGASGASSVTQPIFHAISADGSRIVFGTPIGTPPDDAQIYVREDGAQTIEVSKSQRTVPDPTPSPPIFWGATADGSQVFFLSATALTDDAELGSVSLYRFDVGSRTLADVTPDPDPSFAEPVLVQGVIGMSDDGRYVYFRDTRQHLPGQGVQGQSNLYLLHDGVLRFIATDNPSDSQYYEDNHKTSRLTPDGRHLIFTSTNPLTGYDNTDAVTGARDREVFSYDAGADKLTCVSCRADGKRPIGSATLPIAPARALRNPPRGVSDDGRRVFFDSTDALVPADTNGKVDVYMYEDGAVHLISTGSSIDDSYFAAANANGDDVFFVTREQLAAADDDDNLDVYDARVGGGFPEPKSGLPCSGDGCQSAPAPGPTRTSPGSARATGSGNPEPAAKPKASFRVAPVSTSARRRAARSGVLTLSVRVSEGGILKARASRQVGRRKATVASSSTYPPRAGTALIRLRLSKGTRAALARGSRVKLTVRVSFTHVKAAKTLTLGLER